jgi:hypothetical protein
MVAAFLEVFPDAPTLNLVDPKVGPAWGDLQSLPGWLQSHCELHVRVARNIADYALRLATRLSPKAAPHEAKEFADGN